MNLLSPNGKCNSSVKALAMFSACGETLRLAGVGEPTTESIVGRWGLKGLTLE